ncbi:hypothetical protein EVAR_83570_1 [Eumeta japonica]|uniref:Uncharacterized protein n=1 Tax=Eumeta variegata TaxID=151549 RepID=A0A4C1UNC1_EUMVA|nr:hypothetical protein EVAR_83570_1 [Eumeta japonica]
MESSLSVPGKTFPSVQLLTFGSEDSTTGSESHLYLPRQHLLGFVGLFAAAVAVPVLQPEAVADDGGVPRIRRSHYGPAAPIGGGYPIPAPGYYSLCAGAASHAPYQVSAPAVHAAYGHAGYGHMSPYGLNPYGQHYRINEGFDDSDILMDMQRVAEDQGALARSYGYEEPAAAHAGGALASIASAASGPAVGVFPRGHVGGCNVPLLLSCAPSIVAGQLLHTKPHYGSYGGYGAAAGGSGYRGADEAMMKEASSEESSRRRRRWSATARRRRTRRRRQASPQAAHAAAASSGASHNPTNAGHQ